MGVTAVRPGLYRRLVERGAVSVPELRGRGRALGGDVGLLSGPRPRGDRRRPGGRARAQAHGGWRARLARGRAALAVLRRSRQPRPPADPRRTSSPGSRSRRSSAAFRSASTRSAIARTRSRSTRSSRRWPAIPPRPARRACASSTPRSSRRRTSRAFAPSACCRACRPRIAPRTWTGPIERLGPDRLKGAYAWRSLLDTGVSSPGGSDFPVESPNPFHGIYASVARRPPDAARIAAGSPSSA